MLWMKPSNSARRWQTRRCKCTALSTSPHRFRLHAVNQMLQQLLQRQQRGSWSALQIYNVPRWTRPHHQHLPVRLTFWIYQCHFNLFSHSNDPSSTMVCLYDHRVCEHAYPQGALAACHPLVSFSPHLEPTIHNTTKSHEIHIVM